MSHKRAKRTIDRATFLADLHRECTLRFEPEIAAEMVMEVEVHLNESIQARLELGEAPAVAEINAVTAFESATSFVDSMSRVHRDLMAHDRPLLLLGLAFIFWVGLPIHIASGSMNYLLWMYGVLALAGSVLFRSILICSPRWGTLRNLSIAGVVFLGVLLPSTVLNVWAYGGRGYVSVFGARALVDQQSQLLNRAPESASSFAPATNPSDVQDEIDATKRAMAAPLLERFTTNASQTLSILGFCLGFILVAHLLPVAIRRRWQQLRTPRRGSTA